MSHRPFPLQNRVLPTGEIVADPARGLFTGNRGILPLENGRLGTARWKHPHWIICSLTHPKGRYHGPMPARGWTPLFFLDEAVGLAAGHRPCAYCRPDAFQRYKSLWHDTLGHADHKEMDRQLHQARVTRARTQIRHDADLETLPSGAFILIDDQAHLFHENQLFPCSPTGYAPPRKAKPGRVTVLTPRPSLAVLGAGYAPILHPTAQV